jgi:hypothetical protein
MREIENGYDCSHTGGENRFSLDLDRLGTVATHTPRGDRAFTMGIGQGCLVTIRTCGHRPTLRCWLVDLSENTMWHNCDRHGTGIGHPRGPVLRNLIMTRSLILG